MSDPMLQRPTTNDSEQWKQYWAKQKQSWRTEPEIDPDRQQDLAERLVTIKPSIKEGVYPFKGIHLTRADVEWLLATHDNRQGPIYRKDSDQSERQGVDLRGAYLRSADLSNLPLTRTRFGIGYEEWLETDDTEHGKLAAADLESANFEGSHLEEAIFIHANLKQTNFHHCYLEKAEFRFANLERSDLGATNLHGAYFPYANLGGADLRFAVMNTDTLLFGAHLSNKTMLLDGVTWGGVNVIYIDWSNIHTLGDEFRARHSQQKTQIKLVKPQRFSDQPSDFQAAVRSYQLLATTLRNQGLNEEADRFAYRAQFCQRGVLRRQGWRASGRYLWSLFLDSIAGYGYQPLRTFGWYVLLVVGFAISYMVFGSIQGHPFTFHEGIIFSLTSFHGRGFFPGGLALDDPITTIAAIEAVLGLMIEISFIATFTQRYFGR